MKRFAVLILLVLCAFMGVEMWGSTASTPVVAAVPEAFIQEVYNGTPGQVTGVYVAHKLALAVEQQPTGDPSYVTSKVGHVSQYALPEKYGVVALLGHNTRAGAAFYNLTVGDVVAVVYGDGYIDHYQVLEMQEYQALEPYNVWSNFIDLDNGDMLSATDLFKRVYTRQDTLVFQTCIEQGSELSWGRLFVIARKIR